MPVSADQRPLPRLNVTPFKALETSPYYILPALLITGLHFEFRTSGLKLNSQTWICIHVVKKISYSLDVL